LGFQPFNRIGVLQFRHTTLLVGDLPGTRGTRDEGVELPAVEVGVDFQKLLAAHGQVFSVTAAEPDPTPHPAQGLGDHRIMPLDGGPVSVTLQCILNLGPGGFCRSQGIEPY